MKQKTRDPQAKKRTRARSKLSSKGLKGTVKQASDGTSIYSKKSDARRVAKAGLPNRAVKKARAKATEVGKGKTKGFTADVITNKPNMKKTKTKFGGNYKSYGSKKGKPTHSKKMSKIRGGKK